MTRKNVSALLAVYNEEKVIERCLNSIKGIVDEIIVVHDGECNDKTLEICKKYENTKIYVSSKNVGEAEPHRPFTAKVAKGSWLLPIDADEILSLGLRVKIQNIIKNDGIINNKKFDRFRAKWPEFYKDNLINSNSYKVILTRKSKTKLLGIPHHKWKLKEGNSYDLEEQLIHKPIGGQYSFSRNLKKYHKWARIHAKYLITYLKNPNLIPKINCDSKELPRKSVLRVKHPILSLIPTIISATFLNLKLYKPLPVSLRIKKIFFMLYYQISLSLHLFLFNSLLYHFYTKYVKKAKMFYLDKDKFTLNYERWDDEFK